MLRNKSIQSITTNDQNLNINLKPKTMKKRMTVHMLKGKNNTPYQVKTKAKKRKVIMIACPIQPQEKPKTKQIPLTAKQLEVKNRLDSGDTISLYSTGDTMGYGEYYRWDSDLEVVPSKTVASMKRKGVQITAKMVEGVIVKYDPHNTPFIQ